MRPAAPDAHPKPGAPRAHNYQVTTINAFSAAQPNYLLFSGFWQLPCVRDPLL